MFQFFLAIRVFLTFFAQALSTRTDFHNTYIFLLYDAIMRLLPEWRARQAQLPSLCSSSCWRGDRTSRNSSEEIASVFVHISLLHSAEDAQQISS